MKVPAGFTFSTAKTVGIKVSTLNNQDQPVPGIRINILSDYPENGGVRIVSGMTDAQGVFSLDYRVPALYDSLVVGTTALGFTNFQKVKISGGALACVLGGKHEPSNFKSSDGGVYKSGTGNFYPMVTYNALGVPSYLMPVNDVVENSMIQDINATLPEYGSLPTTHPQYFLSTNEPNLVLNEACDVWVTFIHEGAGYKNVLGYYRYNTNNPPATTTAIDSIHIIFPNISYLNSGGGLTSGNKVHLGIFPPGTELAWVLIADGFQNGTITSGRGVFYSDKELNPEPNPGLKKHTILCNDIGRGKFLLSFEDIRRDGGSDNDFNDAVFYVTASPITAVNTANVPLPNYTQSDTDGDGVSDNFDDYPNDATKAFNNFYPEQDPYGTLVFEDMWPQMGDYDCNDMVINYRMNQITNGANKAVQIHMTLVLQAMGATLRNGFGIQLPVSPSMIASVTGYHLNGGAISLNTNGTEAGQSKATLIAFNNGFDLLPYPGTGTGVNTTPGSPFVEPDTLELTITLTAPVPLSQIGFPPYNPFIFIDQNRGREVHMVNQPPTDLADLSLLGTGADNSNVATGRYYTTVNNLPWVMEVVYPFDYPVEGAEITNAYNKFVPWGESGGQTYFDWFGSKPGYRNTQYIYSSGK